MDSTRQSIAALFTPQRVSVRVAGTGLVTSTPPGLACQAVRWRERPAERYTRLVESTVYYGAYHDEVDELIADNEREAAEPHAAGQAALAR